MYIEYSTLHKYNKLAVTHATGVEGVSSSMLTPLTPYIRFMRHGKARSTHVPNTVSFLFE